MTVAPAIRFGDISQGGLEGPAWRDRFPDLTHIGSKIKPEWMKVWLKDPQKVRPGTYMPTFGLSDKEIDAIVKYLQSLKIVGKENTMKPIRAILFSFSLIGLLTINADAGVITGVVKFGEKTIPPPKMIKITKDQDVCGKGPRPSDAILISKKNHGVQNAVVSLKGIKTDKKPKPAGNLAFVQKGCNFSPHVLMIPVDTEFEIHNKDPLTHNIHTFGFENATINRGQPKTVPVIKHTFDLAERVKVKCDIHKWMQGWFIVVDNPYTVLSGAQGNFRITDVPPGTYTVQVWHEALGPQTQEVTVKGDEEVQADFKLKEKKKRRRKK